MPWLCTVAVLAYVVFYGIGLGPIPFFIGSELFDVGPRPAAMSLGSVFNWGGNFLVGMMFPSLQAVMGPYIFLVFATCTLILVQINQYVLASLLSVLFQCDILLIMNVLFITCCRIYLPETRGRSTTDIAASMTKGFKSRPNARPVA